MRDINRIDKFCNELAELWKTSPDLRFGQFVSNIFDEMDRDPFFPEERDMIKYIRKYFKKEIIDNSECEDVDENCNWII